MYSTILCCVVDVDHPQLLGRPKLLKQLRCADITRLHRLAQARGSQASKGAAATGHGCLQIHISETGFLDESSVDDACYIHTCICICMCICKCIYIYIYMYIMLLYYNVHMYMCANIHIMILYMYTYIYVNTMIYIYLYTLTLHMYTSYNIYTQYIYLCIWLHMYIHYILHIIYCIYIYICLQCNEAHLYLHRLLIFDTFNFYDILLYAFYIHLSFFHKGSCLERRIDVLTEWSDSRIEELRRISFHSWHPWFVDPKKTGVVRSRWVI